MNDAPKNSPNTKPKTDQSDDQGADKNANRSADQLFQHVDFLLGAAAAHQFPDDQLPEIAFAGRSNVGKSSALNALCRRRKLARTSKVPGRTQEINFFNLGAAGEPKARLVDLPGYGFAQVPLSVKEKWQKNIHHYLSKRSNLLILVLLMDIRHPLTDLDKQMLDWASESNLPTQILLTKSDKFKRGKIKQVCAQVETEIERLPGQFAVEPFSVHNVEAVSLIRRQIAEWLT